MFSRRGLVLALAMAALALVAWSNAGARWSRPATVELPRRPSVAGSFTVTYRPHQTLPPGGYYYAVAVVNKDYAAHFAAVRCAKESRMNDTEYGHQRAGKPLTLTLAPEEPASGAPLRWCEGATYIGAIYAVPHPPPCVPSEPCYGHSNAPECYPGETSEPLEYCNEGKWAYSRIYGVVALPDKRGGALPAPRDHSAYIVARFNVTIGELRLVNVRVPRDLRTGDNLTIGFDPKGEVLPEGGYYYAAIILPTQHGEQAVSPQCSRESALEEDTQYGRPRPNELFVKLTLTAADPPFRWCAATRYEGAVYGVLHAECPQHLSTCSQAQKIGRLMRHLRRRAGQLPKPLDTSVYEIGRFQVAFSAARRR